MSAITFEYQGKGVIRVILGLLCCAVMAACASGTAPRAYPEATEVEIPPQLPDEIPVEKVAVCVWPEVGLRKEPGEKDFTRDGKNNYIVTLFYGEQVELMGEEEYVEKKDRTYLKVKLKDGQEGWVYDFLFEPYSRLAVMIEPAALYRRPDPMTLRDDELQPGEIVAVIQDSVMPQGWHHISGWMKKKKGWVRQSARMSFNPRDVELALLRQRAMQLRAQAERFDRLQAIRADTLFTGSPLIPLLEADLAAATPAGQQPPQVERLFITEASAKLYAQPAAQASEVIASLPEGEVCAIITQGQRAVVGPHEDYWYHVRHGEQEGWVFGYYTSRRDLN